MPQRTKRKDLVFTDASAELNRIRSGCDTTKHLRREVQTCRVHMQQNDTQLGILNETADFMKTRQKEIKKHISAEEVSCDELSKLRDDLKAMTRQLGVWINEVRAVREQRYLIENRNHELGEKWTKVRSSVALADFQFEKLSRQHEKQWVEFVNETPRSDVDVRAESA